MACEDSFHVKDSTIFFSGMLVTATRRTTQEFFFFVDPQNKGERERTGEGGEDMKENSKRRRKGRGEKGRGAVGKV